ncbi:MAG: ASCH domain-containing protein [Candidatus Nanoarchaeia archaeon]
MNMDHIAIMNKSWKLIDKIISGQKRIESRWYKAKVAPWNRIKEGEVIYFKDAGEKITAKANVSKVLQFDNLTDEKIKEIIKGYGGEGKICFRGTPEEVFDFAKGKKYCILIFLEKPLRVVPFQVDKTGFGNACAWMCVEDIEKIRIK